jgi:hypothetical protein
LEKGDWVEKRKMLDEKKRDANCSKGKKAASKPRATRCARNLRSQKEVRREDGASHHEAEKSADRSGDVENASHPTEDTGGSRDAGHGEQKNFEDAGHIGAGRIICPERGSQGGVPDAGHQEHSPDAVTEEIAV